MKLPKEFRWKATGWTLGQGGQATVIAVQDTTGQLEGEYALKALPHTKPQIAYERFHREVAAIKKLEHPGIVRIIDHSEPSESFPFYVMELQQGAKSLKNLLNSPNNPFFADPLKSLTLFIEIVQALIHCEEMGIVHRDLSPANVLVLSDNKIKIIDFGLCQIADAVTITLNDEGVGTPNYMAPECESGAEGEISISSDLYSAGKILWSAIVNQNAFSRETPGFGPRSMKEVFPDTPVAWHLHHIFSKTIRQSPKDRFASGTDALKMARHVESLIRSGFPPLELCKKRCPLCGWGKLGQFEGAHMVFGNPNPSGIASLQCNYCGYSFAINVKLLDANLSQRAELR